MVHFRFKEKFEAVCQTLYIHLLAAAWIPKIMSEMKIWLLRTWTKSQSQGPVQNTPENYENGFFTVKKHQMFSVNQKLKASGVFKFLRFEKRIQKALLLEHKCSSVHMISSHTYPISFNVHFPLLLFVSRTSGTLFIIYIFT